MAFVINTFSVAYDQHLGGFVFYPEAFGNFVGNRSIAYQVQVVEIDVLRLGGSFQAIFYQGAGGTAGAVLKYYLGTVGGIL
jgi:hypothetical protein